MVIFNGPRKIMVGLFGQVPSSGFKRPD